MGWQQMLQIDGLTATTVRQLLDQHCHVAGDAVALVGDSGRIWAAVRHPNFLHLCPPRCTPLLKLKIKSHLPLPDYQSEVHKTSIVSIFSPNCGQIVAKFYITAEVDCLSHHIIDTNDVNEECTERRRCCYHSSK